MMTHQQWLNCILTSAQHVASREYQERTWLGGGGNEISSPEEVYCQLIEDCTFDLFFETYSKDFTEDQLRSWAALKSVLERYWERMPQFPDPRKVLADPEWHEVREAAAQFVTAFEQKRPEPSLAGQQ
jgi:hypothetical protein